MQGNPMTDPKNTPMPRCEPSSTGKLPSVNMHMRNVLGFTFATSIRRIISRKYWMM